MLMPGPLQRPRLRAAQVPGPEGPWLLWAAGRGGAGGGWLGCGLLAVVFVAPDEPVQGDQSGDVAQGWFMQGRAARAGAGGWLLGNPPTGRPPGRRGSAFRLARVGRGGKAQLPRRGSAWYGPSTGPPPP